MDVKLISMHINADQQSEKKPLTEYSTVSMQGVIVVSKE